MSAPCTRVMRLCSYNLIWQRAGVSQAFIIESSTLRMNGCSSCLAIGATRHRNVCATLSG